MKFFEISVHELKNKINSKEKILLLDVREPFEYEICRLPNSKLIPIGHLEERLNEIDDGKEIIVYCHHGDRGETAIKFLRQKGFTNVKNLAGGINAWSLKIDKTVRRY